MMNKIKLTILVLFGLLLASCRGDIEPYESGSPDPGESKNSYVITADEALAEVVSFLDSVDPGTRGGRRRSVAGHYTSGGFGATKSPDAEESPYVHIFNFEDDEGFAIVSGDRRVEPRAVRDGLRWPG